MPAPVVVVMGVSGSGKSTVARAMAQQLGAAFVEGDQLHSERNVALMAAGTPLTDDDRRDWLQAVGERLRAGQAGGVVLSCSALKRSYRDLLRAAAPRVRFVFLYGATGLLEQRMHQREGHYMPASLLQSQLDTLEPPALDEAALAFDISQPAHDIARAACNTLEATEP